MSKQGNPARIALVGEMLEVMDSGNPSLVGLKGEIIDETKNTIKIQTNKTIKTIPKDQVTIKVKNKPIDGKRISGRIETRIKQ
jgi:ribonuclease P protein subunit POP4